MTLTIELTVDSGYQTSAALRSIADNIDARERSKGDAIERKALAGGYLNHIPEVRSIEVY